MRPHMIWRDAAQRAQARLAWRLMLASLAAFAALAAWTWIAGLR